jgi:hypothetical protein
VRHVRMLGLCLAAVLAVCAYAVSSASALPEWGKCEAKTGGKYANSNCTEKAAKGKGTFEFKKGSAVGNVKFTGAGAAGVLNVRGRICKGKAEGTKEISISEGSERTKKCEEGGSTESEEIKVECVSENATGEQSGTKAVKNIAVSFHECKALGTIPCQSGSTAGEVDTNPLKGELGYISKAKKEVGVMLTPAAKKGRFATFECGGLLLNGVGVGNPKTEGCVYKETTKCGDDEIISPITPVNEETSTFTQVYTTNEGDENIPTSFEGKPRASLEAFLSIKAEQKNSTLWSKGGEVITNVNTPAEPGEIKA